MIIVHRTDDSEQADKICEALQKLGIRSAKVYANRNFWRSHNNYEITVSDIWETRGMISEIQNFCASCIPLLEEIE